MSCLQNLKKIEPPKPLLKLLKHHFPALFYRFSFFSHEIFYTVVLFLGQLFYTLRGAWRHGTKPSKLEVAGMTSNCFMRHSKCGWNVVNQVPKTIPIDFPAYQKCIGINHQQLEICDIGLTEFPSISTKIGCDGICRTNMNQR